MTAVTDDGTIIEIDDLLDDIYLGQQRLTQTEIHRRAVEAELPADLLTRITAMPEGEYAMDEAADLLGETAR
ncbi:hypothetical protein O7627_06420 [Solwaraspora sp. WMMD1047]|uniref:hypothetical protein n=1 Tax=Solwaraspora sp. WMMD1047 TaxID=3016102 RepID=UPI00241750CB|nr:hypothetical protein [Solwaraspora sp. WMMD1047]MDG4828941.1 hypothetical protein [Solwaraspora sp. WMMD1047]